MTRRSFRTMSAVSILAAALVAACGWDPSRPFDRESPQVNDALRAYDAGEAGPAAELLEDYLTTGACSEGNIGTPIRLRTRPNGSFDLGLTLFKIAETFGRRFGDEEKVEGQLDPNLKGQRSGQVDCALRVVRAIAEDPTQPAALRARARYLEGNLLFLGGSYKEAVTAYEHALQIVPGMNDAGPIGLNTGTKVTYSPDPIGRDAAWNRAIALQRIEDKKDAGNDASSQGDSGDEQNQDGGKNDENPDAGNDGGKPDQSPDAGKDKDSGGEEANKPPPKKEEDKKEPPPPPSRQSQDDRMLDQLENAPTVQQEIAKKQLKARKMRPPPVDK